MVAASLLDTWNGWAAFASALLVIVATGWQVVRNIRRALKERQHNWHDDVRRIVEQAVAPIVTDNRELNGRFATHMEEEAEILNDIQLSLHDHVEWDLSQFEEIRKWRARVDTDIGIMKAARHLTDD